MLVSMIGVGEQTAQLDNVSIKLAEFYEDEVDNIVKNLSSLMEPIIILVIGGSLVFSLPSHGPYYEHVRSGDRVMFLQKKRHPKWK